MAPNPLRKPPTTTSTLPNEKSELTTRQVVSLNSFERTIYGDETPWYATCEKFDVFQTKTVTLCNKPLGNGGMQSPLYPSTEGCDVNPPFLRGGKRGGVLLIGDNIRFNHGWVKQMIN